MYYYTCIILSETGTGAKFIEINISLEIIVVLVIIAGEFSGLAGDNYKERPFVPVGLCMP